MRALDEKVDVPYAFIQWKGTDVCMDCHCSCGNQFHIDDYFAYFVKCLKCGAVYETSVYIKLLPVEDTTLIEDQIKVDKNP